MVLPELKKRIDEEVRKGHFAGRSHTVQYALIKVREMTKKGETRFKVKPLKFLFLV